MRLPVRLCEALDGAPSRPAIHQDAVHKVFSIVLAGLAEHGGNRSLTALLKASCSHPEGMR